MEKTLFRRVFGTLFGNSSYVFVPSDEVINFMAETYGLNTEELKRVAEVFKLRDNLIGAKRNLKGGFLTMKSGEKFSFDEKTLELDNIEVLGNRVASGDNTYVTINGFPLSEKQDDGIREYVRQMILNTEELQRLNNDALGKILALSTPKDILHLCQTNKRFAATCASPETFKMLLNKYYPTASYTNDPRAQFVAITNGVKTFYKMKKLKIEPYMFGEPILMITSAYTGIENNPAKSTYQSNSEYLVFYLNGLPIPSGENRWLLFQDSNFLPIKETFRTKEQLIDYFMTAHYENFIRDVVWTFLSYARKLTNKENLRKDAKVFQDKYASQIKPTFSEIEDFLEKHNSEIEDYLKSNAKNIALPLTRVNYRKILMERNEINISNIHWQRPLVLYSENIIF
jgi:glutaredoxin